METYQKETMPNFRIEVEKRTFYEKVIFQRERVFKKKKEEILAFQFSFCGFNWENPMIGSSFRENVELREKKGKMVDKEARRRWWKAE